MGELNADEWYDVYRQFKPDATREEFEADWEDFQRAKAAEMRRRETQ